MKNTKNTTNNNTLITFMEDFFKFIGLSTSFLSDPYYMDMLNDFFNTFYENADNYSAYIKTKKMYSFEMATLLTMDEEQIFDFNTNYGKDCHFGTFSQSLVYLAVNNHHDRKQLFEDMLTLIYMTEGTTEDYIAKRCRYFLEHFPYSYVEA